MLVYPKLQKHAVVRVGWSTTLPVRVGAPISEVSGPSESTKTKGMCGGAS